MKTALIALLSLYAGVCLIAFVVQRALIYPAPPPRGPITLSPGRTLTLSTRYGTAHAYYLPAATDQPTLVAFHGNGEQLNDQTWLALACKARGLGLLAVEYPGYGLDAAQPISESAIYEAAQAALDQLRGELGVPASNVVLFGRSLGTGVAAEMAARGHGARLILISPYTSMVEMAHTRFPLLPTSLLVRDRFDTLSKAARINQPTLIIHGRNDEVIAVEMARRVAHAIKRAQLHVIDGVHHNDVFDPRFAIDGEAVVDVVLRFAAAQQN